MALQGGDFFGTFQMEHKLMQNLWDANADRKAFLEQAGFFKDAVGNLRAEYASSDIAAQLAGLPDDHPFKKLLGENPQAIFGLALVVAVEELVEELARELVGQGKERHRKHGADGFQERPGERRLVLGVPREGVDDVATNERAVDVVKRCRARLCRRCS